MLHPDFVAARPGFGRCERTTGGRWRVLHRYQTDIKHSESGKQNILFHMRDRTIYRNELPRSCLGLRRSKSISDRTSISRFCNNDFIILLDSYGKLLWDRFSTFLKRFPFPPRYA